MDIDVNLLVLKYKQRIGDLSGDIILLQTQLELLANENEDLKNELQDLKMVPESSERLASVWDTVTGNDT